MNESSGQTDSVAVQRGWMGPLVQGAVWCLCSAAAAVVVWALPRGFNITDEAFYLLNYRYPSEYEANFSSFHLIITRLLGVTDAPLSTYRALGLAAVGVGGTAFGLSLSAWLRALSPADRRGWLTNPSLVVGYVLLGALLIACVFPVTISYNVLNTLFLLLAAAGVLVALRCGPATGGRWLLTAGLALGLDFFIKGSTAVLLGLSILGLLGWCWRRSGVLLRALLWLGTGLAMGAGLFFFLVQAPGTWLHNFLQESAVIGRQGGYRMGDLLPNYLASAIATLAFLVYPMGPALLALSWLAWWWPRRKPAFWSGAVAMALLGGVAAFMAWQALHRLWYSTSISNHMETMSLLLALVLLVATIVTIEASDSTPQAKAGCVVNSPTHWPVALWLYSLPFLAAAGTINDLRLNTLVDMGPWFGLVLVLLAQPRPTRLPDWVMAGLLLLPAGFATEQIIWGTLWTPYTLSVPMPAQNQPLHSAGVRGTLLVDAGTVAYVTQLEKLLAAGGFRPGDPLLAFYDLPGLVYLVGGVSPGASWYFARRDGRNCHALDLTRIPLQKACILLNQPLGPELQSCLREHGMDFPQNYRLVGEVLANTGGKYHTVQVYEPLTPKAD
jgi:hypothetical protein